MKVLIVEDEPNLAEAIKDILGKAKYLSDIAYDGEDGLEYARFGDYDLIIMDGMLPKKDGFSVVRELRLLKISTPIIMLTARDEIQDKIKGLDSGADDYMTKPFVPEELLARIRALSRRHGEVLSEEIEFHDIKLNLSTCDLSSAGKSIHLSYKEFEILKLLILNQNIILSKEALITKVWGDDSDAEDNNVEAYISFLRRKLKFIDAETGIQSIRRVGYRLEYGENL